MAVAPSVLVDYGPPSGPQEVAEMVRILMWSFAANEERLTKATEQIGHGNLRVLRERGKLAAGEILYPMGQWFGGRRVSMAGIGMVGRGAGCAWIGSRDAAHGSDDP